MAPQELDVLHFQKAANLFITKANSSEVLRVLVLKQIILKLNPEVSIGFQILKKMALTACMANEFPLK